MPIQTTPSRIGQVNLAGDADGLFLKVFSGEIISVFEETNLMLPLTKVRTISSGKSATFAVTGIATAGYHTPGESVLTTGGSTGFLGASSSTFATGTATDTGSAKYLSRLRHNEKIIFIDDVLLSSVFVSDIDELKNHYDVRSTYTKEIGRALAIAADKNLIRTVIAGARRGTDRFGTARATSAKFLGEQVDLSNSGSITAESIVIGLFTLARQMDEKDVPSEGRVAILDPASYYLLVRGDSSKIGVAINKDYGGAGSLAGGTVVEVAGIKILKSNHIPTANESSTESSPHGDAGVKNNVVNMDNSGTAGYSGLNYATTKGIAFHTDAVGTVKLMDLSVESEYYMDRLGTLMLAKYAMGHNVLREECCFELTDPA